MTSERQRRIQNVVNIRGSLEFEDMNHDAYHHALIQWDPPDRIRERIDDIDAFQWHDVDWEIWRRNYGDRRIYTVDGVPDAHRTDYTEDEIQEVRDAIHDLVRIWTQNLLDRAAEYENIVA
jgi:hypothetical protein